MRRAIVVATGLVSLAWVSFVAVPGASGFPLMTWVTATITPIVTNGTVSLKLDSEGKLAEGLGKLDGLKKFLEHMNKAVLDAGQRVTSVTVSPTGIVVTTGPAIPPTAG